jgi:hypothetical protein
VLPRCLAELNLGVADHHEIVPGAGAGRGLRLRRFRLLGSVRGQHRSVGGQHLGVPQPLFQSLDFLFIKLVRLLQRLHGLVHLLNRAFQRVEIVIADHRRGMGRKNRAERASRRRT